MFRTMQCILPIAIFALVAASVIPLWPAHPLVQEFKDYLQRKAKVDEANLETVRAKQREQIEAGKLAPEKLIADADEFDLPPMLVGIFERYFAFALVLAFGLTATVGTALAAWIGAKLLANWRRQTAGQGQTLQDQIIRAHTMIALIAGTLSVSIGAACGWLARLAGCYLLAHWIAV
jgi:hypothetical protein